MYEVIGRRREYSLRTQVGSKIHVIANLELFSCDPPLIKLNLALGLGSIRLVLLIIRPIKLSWKSSRAAIPSPCGRDYWPEATTLLILKGSVYCCDNRDYLLSNIHVKYRLDGAHFGALEYYKYTAQSQVVTESSGIRDSPASEGVPLSCVQVILYPVSYMFQVSQGEREESGVK